MAAKILVVQGEVEIRHFVSDALQQAGYDVAAPVDSYVALEMACESAFDLLAISNHLSLIDGPSLVELLHEHQVEIPILVLYNQLSEPEKAHFEALSIQAFLKMPFQVEELLNTIQTLLNTG